MMIAPIKERMDERLLDATFLPLISLMLNTEDRSLLNAGCSCLTVFVSVAAEPLLAWYRELVFVNEILIFFCRTREGKNGVDYLVAFLGRLLSTSLPDTAAIYVGPLIVKLLAKVCALSQ